MQNSGFYSSISQAHLLTQLVSLCWVCPVLHTLFYWLVCLKSVWISKKFSLYLLFPHQYQGKKGNTFFSLLQPMVDVFLFCFLNIRFQSHWWSYDFQLASLDLSYLMCFFFPWMLMLWNYLICCYCLLDSCQSLLCVTCYCMWLNHEWTYLRQDIARIIWTPWTPIPPNSIH